MEQSIEQAGEPMSENEDMDLCIEHCVDCAQTCLGMIPMCLGLGGAHAKPEHIGLLMSCGAICDASAKVMMSRSAVHRATCRACAEICRACAESCEKMASM